MKNTQPQITGTIIFRARQRRAPGLTSGKITLLVLIISACFYTIMEYRALPDIALCAPGGPAAGQQPDQQSACTGTGGKLSSREGSGKKTAANCDSHK